MLSVVDSRFCSLIMSFMSWKFLPYLIALRILSLFLRRLRALACCASSIFMLTLYPCSNFLIFLSYCTREACSVIVSRGKNYDALETASSSFPVSDDVLWDCCCVWPLWLLVSLRYLLRLPALGEDKHALAASGETEPMLEMLSNLRTCLDWEPLLGRPRLRSDAINLSTFASIYGHLFFLHFGCSSCGNVR